LAANVEVIDQEEPGFAEEPPRRQWDTKESKKMAKSVNKVFLLGNVGKDPEIRSTGGGTMVANFSLATSDRFQDAQGNWQDRTEWHNLVAFKRTAEIVRDYVKKGSKLYIEGKIQTRSWDDKDTQAQASTAPKSSSTICRCCRAATMAGGWIQPFVKCVVQLVQHGPAPARWPDDLLAIGRNLRRRHPLLRTGTIGTGEGFRNRQGVAPVSRPAVVRASTPAAWTGEIFRTKELVSVNRHSRITENSHEENLRAVVLLASCLALPAQETRREVTPTPREIPRLTPSPTVPTCPMFLPSAAISSASSCCASSSAPTCWPALNKR
jgi:primosomal replication protein N